MKKEFYLLENEVFISKLKKKRSFLFLVSDLIFLFMTIIFSLIFQSLHFDTTHFISLKNTLNLLPILVFIFFLLIICNKLYMRYINIFKWNVFVTNLRLVVVNTNNEIIKEFYLDNFPKLSFNEYANNNGTLIIGETIQTKEFPNRGYESYSFDLYNIIEIKTVYLDIEKSINKKSHS